MYKKPPTIKLSHTPIETDILRQGVASIDLTCGIDDGKITTGEKYYFFDSDGKMSPKFICEKHKFMFSGHSYQKPYWMKPPGIGSTNNIRTNDDAGIREFEDGTTNEWDIIWRNDLANEF